MNKKIVFTSVLLCLLSFISFFPRMSFAAEDPRVMLNSVANQMISGLKTRKTTLKNNPSVVYSLAYKIIVPHADLDEMSKRVLPAQTWNQASAVQRAAFKKEFTWLLVRTYASALADYTNETVQFYPVRGGTSRASITVNSQIIRTDGPSIGVNYSLVQKSSQWKLYDMTVEGISMLESFRSQFADKLAQGNIVSLISALKQHNATAG